MFSTGFRSILQLLERFPDEGACREYLEEMRWGGGVVSPFSVDAKVYRMSNGNYKCSGTGRVFNVRTGTLFQSSKVPLRKWFVAIYCATCRKRGISSVQLATELNVTQKTAWFMLQKIRECFGNDCGAQLEGDVEVDETYVGGKNKNRHRDKKVKGSQGRSHKDKMPVFGALQRGGRLVALQVGDVTAATIRPIVHAVAKKGSTVHSDEWVAYSGLSREGYSHTVVRHGEGQYVDGGATTNTIEGAWAILKRTVMGTYYHFSRKHAQKYVDEFVFRYNYRKFSTGEIFGIVFLLLENTKLTYKELINGKKKPQAQGGQGREGVHHF